jgi:hypothetical protein
MNRTEEAMSEAIHMVDYASQPDIQFRCDESWSTPKWGHPPPISEGVYLADNDRVYTFEDARCTCQACILIGQLRAALKTETDAHAETKAALELLTQDYAGMASAVRRGLSQETERLTSALKVATDSHQWTGKERARSDQKLQEVKHAVDDAMVRTHTPEQFTEAVFGAFELIKKIVKDVP